MKAIVKKFIWSHLPFDDLSILALIIYSLCEELNDRAMDAYAYILKKEYIGNINSYVQLIHL